MAATVSYGVVRKPWNALQVLKGMRALLLLVDAVFLILILNAATQQRVMLQRIADRELPAVLASERIEVSLERMEAASNEEFLESSSRRRGATQAYENRRSEVVHALLQAVQNSPDQAAGESSLETLQLGLGTYERLIGVSRDLYTRNERGAPAAYEEAASFMSTKLLPTANATERLEVSDLRNSFQAEAERLRVGRAVVVGMGIIELILLVIVQVSLSRRTHRTFNLALLCCTFVLLGTVIHLATRYASIERQLANLEQDRFGATHTLWQVRKTAYMTDLDLSRGLMDSARANIYQQQFEVQAGRIASLPLTLTAQQLTAALREGRSIDGFSGMLAAELTRDNAADERRSLLPALDAWDRYATAGAKVERLQRAGQFEKAVQAYESSGADQPRSALERFDAVLEGALTGTQASLDEGIANLTLITRDMLIEAVAVSLALAALILLGFAPRLREYR